MRKLSAICTAALLALSLAACGSDDEETPTEFATFQLCVDTLKGPEGGKDTKTSIAECISDKKIAGATLTFATKAECVTYVTANTTGFMANAIDQGCQMYIDGK